ncbi:MAG: restriction endonuclease subunit S [Clostridia bacterium]|jgi:type I restriction enzyme S subunit|nr:restriction endonuclease subunit S [Clostridium sp.]MEE0269615.1 restriction endonuclease subunit S [Clostridia bacterium]
MKLTDVCYFQGGSQPPKNQWSDEPREGYIRMLQIRDFTQDNSKVEYVKITNSTKKCEEKDILIARYGASIGKILTGLSGAYNVAMMKVIIDEKIVDRKFIYNFLKSDVFQNYIKNVGQRAAQAGFNKEELSKININLPTLKEQKNVAKELDKVQEIIDIREKQIEELDELIKSQFVEMFGDPFYNEKHWTKDDMGKYISVLTDFSANGSYAVLDSQVKMYDSPNYAYMVRTTDLENNNFVTDVKYIDENAYNLLAKSKVYGNEIIMCKIGSAGKCYLMPNLNKPVSLGRNAFLFRYNNNINPVFIYNLLISDYGQNEISKYVRGAVTKTITKDDARKIKIIIPPIELQNKFAEFVKQIDKQKLEIQKSLEETKKLQESLMNKYFG